MRRVIPALLLVLVCSLTAPLAADAARVPRVDPGTPLGAAIGSPGETVSGKANAGVVHVFRNNGALSTLDSSTSLMLTRSMWFGESTAANDRFGESVAVGDLNGDNLSDVAIGAPGAGGTGRVYVAY